MPITAEVCWIIIGDRTTLDTLADTLDVLRSP